jgi:hypothetical protein
LAGTIICSESTGGTEDDAIFTDGTQRRFYLQTVGVKLQRSGRTDRHAPATLSANRGNKLKHFRPKQNITPKLALGNRVGLPDRYNNYRLSGSLPIIYVQMGEKARRLNPPSLLANDNRFPCRFCLLQIIRFKRLLQKNHSFALFDFTRPELIEIYAAGKIIPVFVLSVTGVAFFSQTSYLPQSHFPPNLIISFLNLVRGIPILGAV